MEALPEDCLSAILSLTSPEDACRLSLVSSAFCSAADSDAVWDQFLPSDWEHLLSTSGNPPRFDTKKELFQSLCRPRLIQNGRMSFNLEKSSGKICYALSARELSIAWCDHPMYWSWKSLPESRFEEAVELITTHWLQIEGTIHTKMLSPNTHYGAYIILKVTGRAYGLDAVPSLVSLHLGNSVLCSQKTLFHHEEEISREKREGAGEGWDMRNLREREDGWVEVELGEFFNGGGGDGEVKMSLKEVRGHQLKGGLIIEGIEVRPKTPVPVVQN